MPPASRAEVRWWSGWPPLLLAPAAVLSFAPARSPRWAVMWALAFTIYGGCKWLTWRMTPMADVSAWRHAAYLLAWPGLDAAAFLGTQPEHPPGVADWVGGVRNLAIGLALLFGIARLVAPRSPYLAGWLGMAGVVLTLHFGLFQLLSCLWRRLGAEARPLMNARCGSRPAKSAQLPRARRAIR